MSTGADFSQYAGRRVLVTGATGFIGRWVARLLTAAGARLWLTVRDAAMAEPLWREYTVKGVPLPLDLTEPAALCDVLGELRPAVVFNLAGYGVAREERDAEAADAINHRWVGRLGAALAAARDESWPGLALVHVGSALEYGAASGNLREDGPTNPTTPYGRSKLAGTQALRARAREHGIRAVTMRLFTVYGPGERAGRLTPTLVEAARHGRPVPLTDGRQHRDFTYVADVAEGLLRFGLLRSGVEPGEAVNLATGRLTSVRDFVLTAARELGIARRRLGFGEVPTRAEEMEHDPVTVARLERHLHWRPATTIREGIRGTADFALQASPS